MPVITFPAVPWPRYFTCQRQSSIIGFLRKIKCILAYSTVGIKKLKKKITILGSYITCMNKVLNSVLQDMTD